MEKKKRRNKKLLLIVLPIILLMIVILFIVIGKNRKNYDISEVEKTFTTYYSDIELESLSNDDIMFYFTLPVSSSEHAILLSNFDPNVEIEDIEEPNLLLLITDLDKDKLNEYYDAIEGFVGSYTKKYDNTKDSKLISLYNESILKKGKNYFYLIMGTKSVEFEEELNKLYK